MKVKVLIVEDELALGDTFKQYLGLLYNVVVCDTAQKAIREIQDITFDAVIIDINLPDMSGLEVASKVRGKFPRAAILMITGDKSAETVKQAIQAGADDYLVKPVDKETINSRLEKNLRKHKVSF